MKVDSKEEAGTLIIDMPLPSSEKGFVNKDAPTVNYVVGPPIQRPNEQAPFCSDKDA